MIAQRVGEAWFRLSEANLFDAFPTGRKNASVHFGQTIPNLFPRKKQKKIHFLYLRIR
jgi:hypothetical protein